MPFWEVTGSLFDTEQFLDESEQLLDESKKLLDESTSERPHANRR